MDSVKTGLLGAGTIGGSVIEVLQNNRDIIAQRANTALEIKNPRLHEVAVIRRADDWTAFIFN